MKTLPLALLGALAVTHRSASTEEMSTPLAEEIVSLRDARILDLGARMGRDRLKVIARAERGEIIRLRFPLVEESEPSPGTDFGLPVLSRAQMSSWFPERLAG